MFSFLTLLIISFQTKQRNFLEALTLGTKGNTNSPFLMSPEDFIMELNRIGEAIAFKKFHLPLPINRDTISQYYQLSTPRSRIVNQQLIITMSIPLVDPQDYDLIKITSFPHLISQNLYTFIVPTFDFIVLDTLKQHYIQFTTDDLENCFDLYTTNHESLLTCMKLTPTIAIDADRDPCEITLLTKEKSLNNCNQRVAKLSADTFIKLRKTNSWVYTIPESKVVQINCDGTETIDKTLRGTGILTIHHDCQLNAGKTLIQGYQNFQNELYPMIQPHGQTKINVSDFLAKFTDIS